MSAPTITPELKALLRRVKLGRCLDTLPERLALAQTGGMGHAEFLELVLADEVTRRETTSADLRARAAGLDPSMRLELWDDTAKVSFDRAIWNELVSLRFVESGHNAVIMGPVGVGKTFLATTLGHIAVRRRHSVHFERCDRLLKRLRASRLDNSHDVEMRKLLRVELLVIDDFALQALDALDTADVYELIVERHRAAATIGWRGVERHFLDLWKDRNGEVDWYVVSGSRPGAAETTNNLNVGGYQPRRVHLSRGGFGDFVGSGELRGFLDEPSLSN